MRRLSAFCLLCLLVSLNTYAEDANRLTYLDEPLDPYYVGRDFPKLTTPQWVGEEGVEAVVVFAIDDMRDSGRYESYLRPILERLKKIDGRAPVSIMTNRADPKDQQLQKWLQEGLTIEIHTYDHPCPCLHGGDFGRAKGTYERCVDLMAEIPGNKPVAFRMPCCDSMNTPSPRFWAEIFNRTTEKGNFLEIDSSVFNVFTSDDPELPKSITINEKGKERFRHYIPFPSFVNTIENYPYPYVIGRLCWQFPCMVPSDWEGQHVQRPNNPDTLRDWKRALDATVIKKGVFNVVFHPHGWIRNDQVVDFIDYAVEKYGKKVKFLNFRESLDRVNKHLLDGMPLRGKDGSDNNVRLLDLNNDGYMDVLRPDGEGKSLTKVWQPKANRWYRIRQPIDVKKARFGVINENRVLMLTDSYYEFVGATWSDRGAVPGHLLHPRRLRDLDGDGCCELLVKEVAAGMVVTKLNKKTNQWERLPFNLPEGAAIEIDGKDGGLRFYDVNQDGKDDVVFSNSKRNGIYLFESMATGWSQKLTAGPALQRGGVPLIVRPDGSNNGAWFHSRHLWLQNEDTDRMPDRVARLSLDDLLKERRENYPTPKTPEQSLKSIKLRDGFEIELVAAEPLVNDPVAFDWGPDGRLWVVEMGDYPNGANWHGPGDTLGEPGGRLKVLEDTNGDGRYDKATLMAEKLNFPNGVKVWREGVLVSAAPNVFYVLESSKKELNDGIPETLRRFPFKSMIYHGFAEGNQQHRTNGLRWGLDNWLHMANGDSGGNVQSTKTGATLNIRGRDLRLRPDDGLLEATSGQTQFGRNRDDWGNWFGGNNSNPMWHYVLKDHYLRRNPHYATPNIRKQVSVQPGPSQVFPTSKTFARFNNPGSANRFTSACSPIVYRDDWFGEAFRGNAFICEPVHNLIHREIMSADGVSFTSRRADDEQQSEFLTSSDNWFRPVMVRTGPDGALWVADMYRFVIEHPEWIPQDWQQRLDMRAGHDKGRIYRIYPKGKKPREKTKFNSLDVSELVAALDSPNGWQRDLVQQMLIWRNDKAAIEPLQKLYQTSKRPLARLHAICTLDGLKCAVESQLAETTKKALSDAHPGVRKHAVRIAERLKDDASIGDQIAKLALNDPDTQVRLQATFSLGYWHTQSASYALGRLAVKHVGDTYFTAAVMSSLHPDTLSDVIAAAANTNVEGSKQGTVLVELAKMAVGTRSEKALQQLVKSATEGDAFHAWQYELLASLQKSELAAKLFSKDQLFTMMSRAGSIAIDLKRPEAERLAAIRLFGLIRGEDARQQTLLRQCLAPQQTPQIQSAAVASLSGSIAARQQLFNGWDSYTPSLRAEVTERFLRDNGSALHFVNLLDKATADGKRPYISARFRQRLLDHPFEPVRKRSAALFRTSPLEARQLVVEKYQAVLKKDGDRPRGKAVFSKTCSACHRLEGVGNATGPDLAALKDRSAQALLVAIFDPNRAVEDKFLDYICQTDDGRLATGMLTNETGGGITLTGPKGKQQTIPRSQIEQLRATGKSLMPEGLEKEVSIDDAAALIAYIRAVGAPPKQFANNRPETVRAGDDGVLRLLATSCKIYGPSIVFEQKYRNLGYWSSEKDHAIWTFEVPADGRYSVTFDYAVQDGAAGDKFILTVADQRLAGTVESTKTWDIYKQKKVGEITLKKGTTEMLIRSDGPIKSAMIDLRGVWLKPIK